MYRATRATKFRDNARSGLRCVSAPRRGRNGDASSPQKSAFVPAVAASPPLTSTSVFRGFKVVRRARSARIGVNIPPITEPRHGSSALSLALRGAIEFPCHARVDVHTSRKRLGNARASRAARLIFTPRLGLDSENVLTSGKICASRAPPDARDDLKIRFPKIRGRRRSRWRRSDNHFFSLAGINI